MALNHHLQLSHLDHSRDPRLHPRDHHFGLTVHPEDLDKLLVNPHHLRTLQLAPQVGDKSPLSVLTKNGFQVSLDVQQFLPNEITVKTKDNVVIVEGRHDEKEDDNGYISRHFIRKYNLPLDIDCADVVSQLSSDGILTIKAHRKGDENERVVHIQHTGPARTSVAKH